MLNFVLIGVCIAVGWWMRRRRMVPADAHVGINAWLIYVAIPATALHFVPQIVWSRELWLPLAMPLVVWGMAWLLLGRLNYEAGTRAALVLGAGLCNTSFVGFPLVSAYYGDAGLRLAVLSDQISFLLLSSVGVMTAAAGGDWRRQLRQVLSFPPLLASVVALLLPVSALDELWVRLGATMIPLALFSIGLQLEIGLGRERKALAQGLGFKLLLAPALVAALALVTGEHGLPAKVSVLEAAMASMATTSVLAARYGLNLQLSNLLIGIGIPLSLLTTAGWWWILERIF
ncbi:hypothetical protein ABS71_11805 [bacterium SCN 62-11]|nr:AEC family transporter [Candidatus Eremiobacteraeota bacterium]ODT66133.1 MAG: hypothetical protein ABS71_11805 [bacterium SCN 62-11]